MCGHRIPGLPILKIVFADNPMLPIMSLPILASKPHIDLSRAPYVLYGVKYIGLVSLDGIICGLLPIMSLPILASKPQIIPSLPFFKRAPHVGI